MKRWTFLAASLTALVLSCSNPASPPVASADSTPRTLPGSYAVNTPHAPAKIAIYYGWPSLVNGSAGNVTTAASVFSAFRVVVFGDGIEHPSHGDNAKTKQIITSLNGQGKDVFGYVDLGVNSPTQNLSVATMKAYVDEWVAMGAHGIFWDDAGYDYGVTRARQNTMVDYCHSKGLKVIMNAWVFSDVASSGTHLGAGDILLFESSLVSGGAYQSLTDWKTKADQGLAYQQSLGVGIACLSTQAANTVIPTSFSSNDQYTLAWMGAALYGFDYFQMTDIWHSAGNNAVTALADLSTTYGTSWSTGVTTVQTSPYPIYTRTSNLWKLSIQGNGSSWGWGGFGH